ncbi:MAG: DNA gyrase inhibitor YacG [Pirellulaceae bacterium]|nr:DNA gyrase inhibitor YacG [Pirellulaceae bacterium]
MANQYPNMNVDSSKDPANFEARCCLCGHPFLRQESKAFPFCSTRCQQIDLGHWLDERLGLPVEGQEDQEFTGFHEPEDEF